MEERVDVKGHLELLEAEVRRVGLQECGCHALVHLLLLRLRGPVLSGICLFVLLLFALPVALAAAVQAAHQLERLRVDRVDAVRINLDPRFEGTRGPLKVGDLLPTIARRLVDVAAHVVDQVQRPRVLLIYFILRAHLDARGVGVQESSLASRVATRLLAKGARRLALLCLLALRVGGVGPLRLVVVLVVERDHRLRLPAG
mmetsp:Transcript_38450/g.90389  ORF Transcript_38450/g.90389 Transcript_38450/m.90389 type:complete len:201 (+) Transcript_38450:231-833(+)